jgi:hypothetical protein
MPLTTMVDVFIGDMNFNPTFNISLGMIVVDAM